MKKEEALKIILKAAKQYENSLVNNNLLFVSCDKHHKITFFETAFYASNFLHLTGVELSIDYINKIKNNNNLKLDDQKIAVSFFRDCLDNKISLDDFDFDTKGQAVLKLEVIMKTMTKNTSANMYGDYNGFLVHGLLYTKKMVGSVNFCLGFVKTGKGKTYVPNTLLKEDIRNAVSQYGRILAIYRKNMADDCFVENVYMAKGIDIKKYRFPKEYKYLKSL